MEKITLKITKSFSSPVFGEVNAGEEREFSEPFASQLIEMNLAEQIKLADDVIDFEPLAEKVDLSDQSQPLESEAGANNPESSQ
ncbi:hypothetical protein [Microbulbifer sp. THAF38]|uniref:hypothetical protein n=1 Tax=Microbulbifer sp. THAF38 TaxID=2587856 RepID=UPI001268B51B|nr:hypothetical protein [Microbulbifer sp. THAF38]QFT53538.1 hypothetical protein FIU95_02995 [Microbulbifer sp. THAF38]